MTIVSPANTGPVLAAADENSQKSVPYCINYVKPLYGGLFEKFDLPRRRQPQPLPRYCQVGVRVGRPLDIARKKQQRMLRMSLAPAQVTRAAPLKKKSQKSVL